MPEQYSTPPSPHSRTERITKTIEDLNHVAEDVADLVDEAREQAGDPELVDAIGHMILAHAALKKARIKVRCHG